MADAILVSACLLGLATRYDGSSRDCPQVAAFLARHALVPVPVCPEQLAGLPTPRPRCWFTAGDGTALLAGHGLLVSEEGRSMNAAFRHGAAQALQVARLSGCRAALLKEGSPSCGVTCVTRNGESVAGCGVTAALLAASGLAIFSEEQLTDDVRVVVANEKK